MLLAKIKGMKVEAADVGNAHLEAYTKEKCYVVAGPEFGDQQGNVLVIIKALYGLHTSGTKFHENLPALPKQCNSSHVKQILMSG